MNRIKWSTILIGLGCILLQNIGQGAEKKVSPLEGAWAAQAIQKSGKWVPEKAVQKVRFTFKGEKLFVMGNLPNKEEQESTFKLDSTKSPKHLQFTPPGAKIPVIGIYQMSGDNLKICITPGVGPDKRSTKFSSKADSKNVLFIFKKVKAK